MGVTGWGSRRNSDSGPEGTWASKGTGNRRTVGGRSWPLGRLGPGHHLCPSFSLTSDPRKEGLEAQVSRLAELIGRLENKVRFEPPPLSLHSPQPPGRAELGPEFEAEVRKPWKGIAQWMVEVENRR